MKNIISIVVAMLSIIVSLSGQTYSKKIINKTKEKQIAKFKSDSLITKSWNISMFSEYRNQIIGEKKREYAPVGVPGDISFRTSGLPISFSRLETDSAGNWKIGQNISLGGSYIWGWGNGTLNPDSSITTEQHFFFGFTGNFGVVQDKNNSTKLSPSITLGGIIGFSSFAVMLGTDVLNKTPIIGIAYNISGFPLLKNLTHFKDYPTKKIGK
jgi:hypothetical protein